MHTEKQEIAMIVQLSSGQGPSECELAVLKLYPHMKQEKKGVTRLLYLPQNGICQTWKEAFNGYAEVHFDRIISGKTGL